MSSVIFSSYLDPESMATPTVQNWPNFCSDATRIPFSRRVTRVSEEGVAVRYVGVARPANGWTIILLSFAKRWFFEIFEIRHNQGWLCRQIVPLRDSLDLQMGADWRWGARCSYTSVKPASRLLPHWTQWSAWCPFKTCNFSNKPSRPNSSVHNQATRYK